MNVVAAPAESKNDTKTRILDAAERVFSGDGFDAASLRTITTAAQVNLAAVNYHFHSKEALFCAVIERRATPLNKRRIDMLEAIPGKLTPERILEAFLRPVMERSSTELALFRPLIARLHSVPVELHKRILDENFAPTLNRFVDALSVALPQSSREDLKLGMFFIVGSMSQAMAWEPIIADFMGSRNAESFLTRLVSFGAAGMKAGASKRVNQ